MQKSTVDFTRDYVSATVAGAMVGVSAGTLPRWEKLYGFPSPRYVGMSKWYSSKAIEAWLKSPDRLKPTFKCGPDHPRAHPKEFVAQALKLHMQGVSLGRIAQRLGVPKATVQHWVEGTNRAKHPADAKVRARAANR